MQRAPSPGWVKKYKPIDKTEWPGGIDPRNPRPQRDQYDSDEAFIAAARSYQISEPRRVDRAERQFGTYEEAEWNLGITLPAKVRALFSQYRFEQRTPEWLTARQYALTASDLAGAIGCNPYQTLSYLIQKKTEGSSSFTPTAAIAYGVENEDCALHLYEQKTGAVTLDFGLLSHWSLFADISEEERLSKEGRWQWFAKVHAKGEATEAAERTWLKGSPDGVALLPNGDLAIVEIKCPTTQFKAGFIAGHYYPQVQLLMELTDIDKCHFIQYNRATVTKNERYDMIEIARNREWFEEARRNAWSTWQVIVQRRQQSKGLPQLVPIDKKALDALTREVRRSDVKKFPPCVLDPRKKRTLQESLGGVSVRSSSGTSAKDVRFVDNEGDEIKETSGGKKRPRLSQLATAAISAEEECHLALSSSEEGEPGTKDGGAKSNGV